MKGEERMTEAQKKAVEVQKEIEEVCIRHGLNLTIFENGIGFVDPKENKIVMVWRPQYKPETPSLRPMEENTQTDFKPATQKPSGGNMAAFIYGNQKVGGRFVGNRKKHKIRGMKKR
jgi:hypothetical protein